MQYLDNMEVVDDVGVEDYGQDESNMEFTKGDDKLYEFEESSDNSNVKDIDFKNNVDDRDDDDYFNMNVDSFAIELTFVIEDEPYELPNF